jgi:hypothetical protein
MFENLRQTLRDLAAGAIPASQKAAAIAQMKATLVQARVGVADIAAARDKTKTSLDAERAELATVQRRLGQAREIGDNETVNVATRFEKRHSERVEVLGRKLAALEDELSLAEAELSGMTAELKTAASLAGSVPEVPRSRSEVDDLLSEGEDLRRDLDGLARQKLREMREVDADEKLAELKRRMNK